VSGPTGGIPELVKQAGRRCLLVSLPFLTAPFEISLLLKVDSFSMAVVV